MPVPIRVLILEDHPTDAELMVLELKRAGFAPSWERVDSEPGYLEKLGPRWDVILSDYVMPQFKAPRALQLLKKSGLEIPFIIVTGSISEEIAVESLKQGATDYLLKDRLTRLGPAVKQALEQKKLREEKLAERKRAEEEQKRLLDELTSSNEDLRRFAHVASHDLHEALRMVSSYVQLLARKYQGKLDENADRYINFIIEGSVHMEAMLNALLDYSQVETQRKSLEPVPVEGVVKKILDILQVFIRENGAQVTYDPLPEIMADKDQISRVFQNLISNSIKFRGDEPPRIHISAEDKGNEWLFSVRDNGIGIDPRFKEKVFEILQRLQGRKYPGTGIGLTICKKIVEKHGGRIWVDSEPGKGSTFFFTLPK